MSHEVVVLGKVVAHHGLGGWVKLLSFTRPIEQILAYPSWYLLTEHELQAVQQGDTNREAGRRWQLSDGRLQGKSVMARLQGCRTREQAEPVIGLHIAVERQQLPGLAPGEYYWADLIGLEVFNTEDVRLGTLVEMLETGANDVMRVCVEQQQRLIPWSPQTVVAVHPESHRLVVDWDETF